MKPEFQPQDNGGASSLLSVAGVSALLDKRLSQGQGPVTLVLWNSDPALAEALLARPDVTSVILRWTANAQPAMDPQRCGWWGKEPGQGLVLPGQMARELHSFIPGGGWGFGFRDACHTWRRGVSHIVFHDVDLGSVRSSLLALMRREFGTSMRYRFDQSRAAWIMESINRLSLKGLSSLFRAYRGAPCVPGRVLLVTGSLGPGGSERQTVNTLLGLKAAGMADLSLLHTQPLTPPYDFFHSALVEAGIPCLHLVNEAVNSRSLGSVDGDFLRILRRIEQFGIRTDSVLNYARVFHDHRPEIVHTWLDEINVTAGIAAVLVGVPKVVIGCRSLAPYNFPFYRSYMRPLYELLAGQPNVTLLNNSQAGASDYRQWLGVDCPVRVIHNGFRFEPPRDRESASKALREDLGIAAEAAIVGTVMRLSDEKRPHLWLDAAERVGQQRQNVCFVMIGDGPLMTELKARVAASPLRARIKLLGKRRDVDELLSAMDVFVLTSVVEGLPNVLIEAQAEGVPVVSSDVGGVREIFRDGDTGVILTQPTAEGVAEGVLRVLDDPALVRRARETSPGAMRELFSVERMVHETMEVYGMTAGRSCR